MVPKSSTLENRNIVFFSLHHYRNHCVGLDWSAWRHCWYLSRVWYVDACWRGMGRWGAYVDETSSYSKRNWAVNVQNQKGKNLETPIFLLFRADSVTWNPHKLLGVPQQCSTFLTRHPNLLLEANSASASYLFQKDKFYDPKWDVGDKYLQCGRRADVLKFWLMWQAKVNFHLH